LTCPKDVKVKFPYVNMDVNDITSLSVVSESSLKDRSLLIHVRIFSKETDDLLYNKSIDRLLDSNFDREIQMMRNNGFELEFENEHKNKSIIKSSNRLMIFKKDF
jgi:hypothetical protein